MSHFILHKKWKGKKGSYLLAGLACVMLVWAAGYGLHSIGTARAKSRETIVIYTAEELEQYLLDRENEEYNLNGNYRLEDDLDLGWLYESIGTNLEPFTGSFDGNGHVISGLTRPLFGVLSGAEVEHLFLSGAVIENPCTYYNGEQYVDGYGALAAYAVDSMIRNCGMGGEIHIASPSEAEYLLEKASPSEAEEEKGPGVPGAGGITEPAGGEESITQNPTDAGPGIEEEPLRDSAAESTGEEHTIDDAGKESTTAGVPEGEIPKTEPDGSLSTEAGEESSPVVKPSSGSMETSGQNDGTEETPIVPGANESTAEIPGTEAAGAETPNAGIPEADTSDAEKENTGTSDTGASDTGASDTGASDTGASDTGASEINVSGTVAIRPVLRERLMKTPPLAKAGEEELLVATPSDAEEPSMASPPDAEDNGHNQGQEESGTHESGINEPATEEPATEPEYIGNPNGDICILVTAECITAGGLISQTDGTTLISDCFAFVTISEEEPGVPISAGGLAGILGGGSRTENSYASGLADSSGTVGGLMAVNNGVIGNCYSTMVIGERSGIRGAFTAAGTGELTGCVYDRQMACVDEEDAAAEESGLRGLDTSQMTGADIQIPGTWYTTEDTYPQIEYFAFGGHEAVKEYSKVSAIALPLPKGMTLKDALTENGPVLPLEIDGEAIRWEAEGAGFIDEENRIQIQLPAEIDASVSPNEVPKVGTSLEQGLDVTENRTPASVPENETPVMEPEDPVSNMESGNRETEIEETSTIRLKATVGSQSRNFTLNAAPRATGITGTTWSEVGTSMVQYGTPPAGSGSASDPYQLGSAEELAWFMATMASGGDTALNAELTADIDLTGSGYGASYTTASPMLWDFNITYKGIFDGKQHTISYLKYNNSPSNQGGLFKQVHGTVQNLYLSNIDVYTWSGQAGGICGFIENGGLIKNCGILSGNIRNAFSYRDWHRSGGIVGQGRGTNAIIQNCFNRASVYSRFLVGGVSGQGGKAINFYNAGILSTPEGDGLSKMGRDVSVTNAYSSVNGNGEGTVVADDSLKCWAAAYMLNEQKMDGPWKFQGIGEYVDFGSPTSPGRSVIENWEDVGAGIVNGWFPDMAITTGDGTPASPYEIGTAEQLAEFAARVNMGNSALCAKLVNNIDLKETTLEGAAGIRLRWIPIGTETSPYTGTFDGNGKFISNMTVEQKGAAGLFGYVGGGAVIRKVGLAPSCRVKNTSANDTEEVGTAGLVATVVESGGSAGITVENCYNRGRVEGRTGRRTGAFVGFSDSYGGAMQKITNSYTTGLLTSVSGQPGAIAGTFAAVHVDSKIAYCFWDRNTSAVSGSLNAAIIGPTRTTDCASLSTFDMNTAAAANAGGLLERLNTNMAASWQRKEAMNDGYPILVPGYESWADIGALAGSEPPVKTPSDMATAGQESNPYQIGTPEELAWFAYQVNHVSGKEGICGELTADISLFGEQHTGSAYDPAQIGRALRWIPMGTPAKPYTGTLNGNGYKIKEMYIKETDSGIGFIGSLNGGTVTGFTIENCLVYGGHQTGGIVGELKDHTDNKIINCHTVGGTVYGQDSVGGIAGGSYNVGARAEIKGCTNSATVETMVGSGNGTAGGIVGYLVNGTIRECLNTGTVKAYNGCGGGIVGGATRSGWGSSTVVNCLNAGLALYKATGGVASPISGHGGTVTNSYFDNEVMNAGGGNGRTTAQLKTWGTGYQLNGKTLGSGWIWPDETSYPVPGESGVGSLRAAADWSEVGEWVEIYGSDNGMRPSGSGTTGTPYQIGNAEQLAWLAYRINRNNEWTLSARLTADISLLGKDYTAFSGDITLANIENALQWKPMGGRSTPYQGTFDGGGYEIDGMYINGRSELGLFGAIQYPAKIQKLGIGANSKVIGTGANSALFAGCSIAVSGGGSEIRDCYNLGTLESSVYYAAAFIGDDLNGGYSTTISNCYNAGNASAFAMIDGGKIDGCYADITVNANNGVHVKNSGNGVTGLTTAQMKTNPPVTGLNRREGVLRTGTDRVWFTSLDSEKMKGYPTFKAPTTVAVEFIPDTPEGGTQVSLPGGLSITDMKLRSFGSVDQTFTPGSSAAAGAEFTLAAYTDLTGADSNYHKYGYTNANRYLGFQAGAADLNGKTASLNEASLSVPVEGVGTVASVSLGRAAAYTKPEDRYILLEGASGTNRYEIQMTVKGATSKTLSVVMPVKVTLANLTPDGTDHTVGTGTAGYSLDLSITNRNAYPIDGKILRAEPKPDAGYARLIPVKQNVPLSNTGLLSDAAGGVRLGLTDKSAVGSPLVGNRYYDKDAASGTAWMEYSLKHGGTLGYRYFMEYSGLHGEPDTRFGYDISYWFGVSEGDYTSTTADAVVR